MTQENKQLLLQDLCARLPYGVKVYAGKDFAMTLRKIDYKCFCESWENEDFKSRSRWMLPYLRPMSSMTEEEKSYMEELSDFKCTPDKASQKIDFYNSHHVDYRGLIPMGLALEAPEDMYNTKTE